MSGQKVKRKAPERPKEEKPSGDEYAIANYLREHVPRKKTKFLHHPVEYFTAARAVDALMDSPWASGADKRPLLFTDRDSVVEFLDMMLRHKFFHRAKKIAISDRDLRRKQLKKLKKKEEEERKKKFGKEAASASEDGDGKAEDKSNAEETAGERSAMEDETPKTSSSKEQDKPKRRIKLDMHLEQVFVDGTDAYVWIYDPIPTHYWLLGFLIVAAIVVVCLFPLWPSKLREYVYYLSLAAAAFLAVVLALAVLRAVLFVLIWAASWGRHRFWLLPNLTEDVGFFASFWPLYQYEYKGKKDDSSDEKNGEKKPKAKSSSQEGGSRMGQHEEQDVVEAATERDRGDTADEEAETATESRQQVEAGSDSEDSE